MQSILTIQSWSRDRSRSLAIARGEEWERTGWACGLCNINSHTTSLSTDLKLDPESRSRSRTVRPTKGRGWERGVEHVGNINSHSQPTLNLILGPDPDPEQSGLLKGGGGREGWNMWVILTLTLNQL